MTDEQSILIDILKIVPENSVCYLNAPSIDDNSDVLKLLSPTSAYDWCLILTSERKEKLIEVITSEGIQDYFHRLDIKYDDSVLCESYDGMCTVILTERIRIPNWFSDKYVQEGLCWTRR